VSRTDQLDEIILPSNDSAILFLIRVDSLHSRWAAASHINWLNYYESCKMIRLQRILAPIDFSELGETALRYATQFAARFEAELHLLSVVQSPLYLSPDPTLLTGTAAELGEQWVNATRKQLDQLPLPVELPHIARVVLEGAPVVEIVRYARENEVDLIVIGTHGRTGLAHVFLGSVAENVVRKSPCPVLTVRHPEHEFVMP
jgi:nucleotide-binding universal stress UspA family protein